MSSAPSSVEARRDLVVRSLRASKVLWEVVSETLDMPVPSLFGLLGSNPYGVDVGKLVYLRDTLVPEKIMHLTLSDIVNGAISDDESVRARYLGWIAKAKAELSKEGKVGEAARTAADIRKELAKGKKAFSLSPSRPADLVQELKVTGKKLEEKAKTAASIRMEFDKKKKPISVAAAGTPICEILSELLGRLGITDHVAYLSALVQHAQETRSVLKGTTKPEQPNSLGEMAAKADSGPSILSILSKGLYLVRNAAAGGSGSTRGKAACSTVFGVIVCDKAREGEGIPDGASFGRRYVIHADPMTLERGPGFRVDAFDVLDRALATFEIAATNLIKDKDHCRTYVHLLLDALAEAFEMPASHATHEKFGGGGGKMLRVTTTTGGCAMCAERHVSKLEKLGIVQKGQRGGLAKRGDRIIYVQQPPAKASSNDTYFATCFGCLVLIDLCECCMECGDYLDF